MENRVFFGLIMLGEGLLALNYIIFCFIASLGVLQFVAARYGLRGMLLLPQRASTWAGLALILFAYVWFFAVQPDLYIPGLAGGELSTFAVFAFLLALVASFVLGYISHRVLKRTRVLPAPRRERIRLSKNATGELWLPSDEFSILILALREAASDSLDILARDLVTRGAAVLICDERLTQEALDYMRLRFEPLVNIPWGAVGCGTGGDRVLSQEIADHPRIRRVIALAPYGAPQNRRVGLRWLRETDYFTAFNLSRRAFAARTVEPEKAVVVYGDEDTLIAPGTARSAFPRALMVAAAHHFDLAAQPATLTLAVELFQLGGRRSLSRGGAGIQTNQDAQIVGNGGVVTSIPQS